MTIEAVVQNNEWIHTIERKKELRFDASTFRRKYVCAAANNGHSSTSKTVPTIEANQSRGSADATGAQNWLQQSETNKTIAIRKCMTRVYCNSGNFSALIPREAFCFFDPVQTTTIVRSLPRLESGIRRHEGALIAT